MKQRVRIEERWEARKSAPDFDEITSHNFETILRYRLRFDFPTNANTYPIIYDEIFLRLEPRSQKWIDQNRLFGGLGFHVNNLKLSRIEIGYMLQTERNSAETSTGRKRVNNVIRITFISD